jgi:hypothetical protein
MAILIIFNVNEVVFLRKIRKMNFRDLVNENKRQLLNDEAYIEALEKKLEEKHMKKA